MSWNLVSSLSKNLETFILCLFYSICTISLLSFLLFSDFLPQTLSLSFSLARSLSLSLSLSLVTGVIISLRIERSTGLHIYYGRFQST